mgnify:CR=1 FL=1
MFARGGNDPAEGVRRFDGHEQDVGTLRRRRTPTGELDGEQTPQGDRPRPRRRHRAVRILPILVKES